MHTFKIQVSEDGEKIIVILPGEKEAKLTFDFPGLEMLIGALVQAHTKAKAARALRGVHQQIPLPSQASPQSGTPILVRDVEGVVYPGSQSIDLILHTLSQEKIHVALDEYSSTRLRNAIQSLPQSGSQN